MQFLVYYWLRQGDKAHSLCEHVQADSLDHATHLVGERLLQKVISFDSDGRGRVVVHTDHIQFAEIEKGGGLHDENQMHGF